MVRPPAIAAGAAVWNCQSLGQHSVGQRTHWEKISFSSGIWAGHHHTHQPEDIISKVRKYGDHVIMSMIIRWSQWYQHNNDKTKGGKSDCNHGDDENHDYQHKIRQPPTQIAVCAHSLQLDFIKSEMRENIAILRFFLSTVSYEIWTIDKNEI